MSFAKPASAHFLPRTWTSAYAEHGPLFVLSDAGADPEADVHAFLMERILPRQAHIIQVADLEELLA